MCRSEAVTGGISKFLPSPPFFVRIFSPLPCPCFLVPKMRSSFLRFLSPPHIFFSLTRRRRSRGNLSIRLPPSSFFPYPFFPPPRLGLILMESIMAGRSAPPGNKGKRRPFPPSPNSSLLPAFGKLLSVLLWQRTYSPYPPPFKFPPPFSL